jgi:hypothetical protein
MLGFLYRWSLQATGKSENALDLALAVFNVVNAIQQNDVDRRHWFTLLAKRIRSSVGMAEAIDLATQLMSDDATDMELCMEDLVEDDALCEENIRNAATL